MSKQPVVYPFPHTLAKCDSCPLISQRERTWCPSVPPRSDNWSGLMLIGEGPGYNEARLKEPFVGPSGQLLNALLEAAGLKRSDVYIANATSCLPTREIAADKKNSTAMNNAVLSCMSRLEAEILTMKPRVIVTLGAIALDALVGVAEQNAHREKILCPACDPTGDGKAKRSKKCEICHGYKNRVVIDESWRSEWSVREVAGAVFDASNYNWDGVKYIIPTYHPAHLLRKADKKGDKQIGGQFLANAVVRHLQKAKRLLSRDAQWRATPEVTRDPERLFTYAQDPEPIYSVDIETDKEDTPTQITCFCIDNVAAETTLVVDLISEPPTPELMAEVRAFMLDHAAKKCFHNGSFDVRTMRTLWGVDTGGYVFDTMVAHNAVAPDEPHSLAHCTFLYTDSPPWKPPKKKGGMSIFESNDELFTYNARDGRNTSLVRVALQRALATGDAA